MALKAGRVGVAPDQVDSTGRIKGPDIDLSAYVKKTDYATEDAAGVVKVDDAKGTATDTNGILSGVKVTKAAYTSADDSLVVSKGTIENLKSAGYFGGSDWTLLTDSEVTTTSIPSTAKEIFIFAYRVLSSGVINGIACYGLFPYKLLKQFTSTEKFVMTNWTSGGGSGNIVRAGLTFNPSTNVLQLVELYQGTESQADKAFIVYYR